MGEHSAPEDPKPLDELIERVAPPPPGVTRTPREYWRDVGERAVRTFAQTMLAVLGVGSGVQQHFHGAPWLLALEAALVATVISVLMSLAGGRLGDPNSGSWRTT